MTFQTDAGWCAGHCYGCDESAPVMPTKEEAETAAYEADWQIGHMDGQAHYACPRCAVALWDPTPLYPMHWTGRRTIDEMADRQAAGKVS